WISGLSKTVLCQIVWMAMMQYHDSTLWPELEDEEEEERGEGIKQQEDGLLQELKTIQEQANQLAHRLDAMRPSEQFVHAAQVAQEFQQLIRLCVHLLHKNPLAATLGIMLIVQQSFGAPPEVRQHVYYQAKLGRLVVLELESILNHHADYLVSCVLKDLDASTMSNSANDDWLEQLEQLCTKLSRYDTTWEFRQEYQNVVRLAEQFY
ncbi:hypothetical protein BDB00DRAFT_748812, partial [Zychaea mexicana]|uniref:uncharacterized protein n=1 Tax=Zychaea mexicana TaxID=64656 RepID=UPI0022FE29B7